MGSGDDRHDKFAVINGVHDAIVADANAKKPGVAGESAYAGWPRLVGQSIDRGDDPDSIGPVDLAELAECGGCHLDCVRHPPVLQVVSELGLGLFPGDGLHATAQLVEGLGGEAQQVSVFGMLEAFGVLGRDDRG
jgi:hypothetical protein